MTVPSIATLAPAFECTDRAVALGDQHDTGDTNEESGADDAGNREQLAFEPGRAINHAYAAIHHHVAIVGQELAAIGADSHRGLEPHLAYPALRIMHRKRNDLDRQTMPLDRKSVV